VAERIIWNEEAIAQGADERDPDEVMCPECETTRDLGSSVVTHAGAASSKGLRATRPYAKKPDHSSWF
jgi:hypothetical protein